MQYLMTDIMLKYRKESTMNISDVIISNSEIVHIAKIKDNYYQMIYSNGFVLLTKAPLDANSEYMNNSNCYFTRIDLDIVDDVIDYQYAAKYFDSYYGVLDAGESVYLISDANNAADAQKAQACGFTYNREMAAYIKIVPINAVEFIYLNLGSQIEKYKPSQG